MSEKIWMWLAWRLPRRLVYWCAIRLGSYGTRIYREQEVPALLFMDALQRWDKKEVKNVP
jgi:hypothetical protein